jgi:phospholipase C
MRRSARRISLRVALTAVLAGVALVATFALRSPAANGALSPIRHVVIIYNENHSFDNVLGLLCAVEERCDGATTGEIHSGTTIPLQRARDIVPGVGHSTTSQQLAIDGGRMDGFDLVAGCGAPNYRCYTQFTQAGIPNLWALASAFAVSDRTFESYLIPSWGAHLELIAQTLDGFTGTKKPQPGQGGKGPGWGCDSLRDADWMDSDGNMRQVPACVPDEEGDGPYRSSPVEYVPTLLDRLDEAGKTYRIYSAPESSAHGYAWNVCTYFYECQSSAQAHRVVDGKSILDQVRQGSLPNFSLVLPWSGIAGSTSQHNFDSMLVGDDWIGQVVGAIENSRLWKSTAIFITYDDCGCFYDHVAPPGGLGIRVPMVIVSPYARPGFTDSTVTTFSGMIAYTEHLLGLQPLTDADATAYDYSDAFDYGQPPLPPVRMVRDLPSERELRWIAEHPEPYDAT